MGAERKSIPADPASELESPWPEAMGLALPLTLQGADMGLGARLDELRRHINARLERSGLHRIAVAVFEPETDQLKTYVSADDGFTPLVHYDALLHDIPTLERLASLGGGRVVDDYLNHPCEKTHSREIRDSGFRSALILPLNYENEFYGFIFFNSRVPHFFNQLAVDKIGPFADIARLLAVSSIRKNRVLRGAAQMAMAFGRARDDETGAHLQRMAEYSRLIAHEVAPRWGLKDEFVEMVYQFAPVHDIGKIAIPDAILLKPGPLNDDEFALMREHVTKGVAMVLSMARALDLEGDRRTQILRNIVGYHHERLDGSGYPTGAVGDRIPLEGRIVAVADVFDALTSHRVYKPMWSFEEAAAVLTSDAAAGKLCPVCVEAFLACRDRIDAIRQRNGID